MLLYSSSKENLADGGTQEVDTMALELLMAAILTFIVIEFLLTLWGS